MSAMEYPAEKGGRLVGGDVAISCGESEGGMVGLGEGSEMFDDGSEGFNDGLEGFNSGLVARIGVWNSFGSASINCFMLLFFVIFSMILLRHSDRTKKESLLTDNNNKHTLQPSSKYDTWQWR